MNLSRSSCHHTETFSNSGLGRLIQSYSHIYHRRTHHKLKEETPGTVFPSSRVLLDTKKEQLKGGHTTHRLVQRCTTYQGNSYNLDQGALQVSSEKKSDHPHLERCVQRGAASNATSHAEQAPRSLYATTSHRHGTCAGRIRTPWPVQGVCQARRSRTSPKSKTCEVGGAHTKLGDTLSASLASVFSHFLSCFLASLGLLVSWLSFFEEKPKKKAEELKRGNRESQRTPPCFASHSRSRCFSCTE